VPTILIVKSCTR